MASIIQWLDKLTLDDAPDETANAPLAQIYDQRTFEEPELTFSDGESVTSSCDSANWRLLLSEEVLEEVQEEMREEHDRTRMQNITDDEIERSIIIAVHRGNVEKWDFSCAGPDFRKGNDQCICFKVIFALWLTSWVCKNMRLPYHYGGSSRASSQELAEHVLFSIARTCKSSMIVMARYNTWLDQRFAEKFYEVYAEAQWIAEQEQSRTVEQYVLMCLDDYCRVSHVHTFSGWEQSPQPEDKPRATVTLAGEQSGRNN